MKLRKIAGLAIVLTVLAGCNNGSLLSGSESLLPPEGKLFAQVSLSTVQDLSTGFMGGKDRTNDVEDVYEIRIDAVSLDVGSVSFATDAAATLSVFKAHEGEDHGDEPVADESEGHAEPTSCDFEGSFTGRETVDLKEDVVLPCFVTDSGTYAGLNATLGPLTVSGTALKDGTTYPFEIRSTGSQAVVIAAETPFALNEESHHIAVRVDVKGWFHGVDFAELESVDGVVLFDEAHNTHRFEHMVNDHVPESFSLEVRD